MDVSLLKVLVLGGSGFIGRRAVESLRRRSPKLEIVAWSRAEHGDLLNPSAVNRSLKDVKPDCVVHLAWSSTAARDYRNDPENESWVGASAGLVDEAQRQGVRLILTGSALDDATAQQEETAYGRAKIELRSRLAPLISQGELTWLRPHYVISVADQRPNILRDFINADPSTPFYARTPAAFHDFIEVRDVGSAIAAVVEYDLRGLIEIGSGTLRSVDEVLAAVGRQRGLDYSSAGLPTYEPPRQGADITRLLSTGWHPRATEALFLTSSKGMNS